MNKDIKQYIERLEKQLETSQAVVSALLEQLGRAKNKEVLKEFISMCDSGAMNDEDWLIMAFISYIETGEL